MLRNMPNKHPDAHVATKIEEIWERFQDVLRVTFVEKRKLDMNEFMEFYSKLYDFCTNVAEAANSVRNSKQCKTDATCFLYEKIRKYIDEHVGKLSFKFIGLHDEEDMDKLLDCYIIEWREYINSSCCFNGACGYLNRKFAALREEYNFVSVYEMHDLAFYIWRENLLKPISERISTKLMKLIDAERRDRNVNNSKIINDIVKSFIALDRKALIDCDRINSVYDNYFAKEFLLMTDDFYFEESEKILNEKPINEYIDYVLERYDEEKQRAELYLQMETSQVLFLNCDKNFIENHIKHLQTAFEDLLKVGNHIQLKRLYSLVKRVLVDDEDLPQILEKHIFNKWLGQIEELSQIALQTPEIFIKAILNIHHDYARIVNDIFDNERGFRLALKSACRKMVNYHQQCSDYCVTPGLLTKYCDVFFRKTSQKNQSEEYIASYMGDIMIILELIEDRDVFQMRYSRSLIKRLLHNTTRSLELEGRMVEKLADICSNTYIFKYKSMIQDIVASRALHKEFKRSLREKNINGINFRANVLSTIIWPFQRAKTELFALPSEMAQPVKHFNEFYVGQHSGRKLHWLHHLSKGELYMNFSETRHVLIVSSFQMAVLLQYNDADKYTLEQLVKNLDAGKDNLILVLRTLILANLLRCDDDCEFTDSSTFELCTDFKHTNREIYINQTIKLDVKSEETEVAFRKHLTEDRMYVIQAAIVRILKSRRRLADKALVAEVFEQLSKRFKPKLINIKKCIEILIVREYITRVDGRRDMYSYNM